MGSKKEKAEKKKTARHKKWFIQRCNSTKEERNKTFPQKEKWNIHKCVAQVSPTDFVFSYVERYQSHSLLSEEREIPRVDSKLECTRRFLQGHKLANKILMLTMKSKAQQQGFPVSGVLPLSKKDSDMCLNELDERTTASTMVPLKLFHFLLMELETRFDPSLRFMVGELMKNIWFEIVRKGPLGKGGCQTEKEVVARLVEEFGLLSFPRPPDGVAEDVLMDVVQKCVVAFQMLEAEAVVLEQGCF